MSGNSELRRQYTYCPNLATCSLLRKINSKFALCWSGNEIVQRVVAQIRNGEVIIEDETVWLTQQQMAELFQTSKSNVSDHIKHIFDEAELDENSVVRKFRTTASDVREHSLKRMWPRSHLRERISHHK